GFGWSRQKGHTGHMKIEVTVKNLGRSPARLVRAIGYLHPPKFGLGEMMEQQRNYARQLRTIPPEVGITLFPGDERTLPAIILLVDHRMTETLRKRETESEKPDAALTVWPPMHVVGCVDYGSTINDDFFQ